MENRMNSRNQSENFSEDSNQNCSERKNDPVIRGMLQGPILHNIDQQRIRIDKLGVVFDGNSAHMGVEDFIFRLGHLQSHFQIPWSEVLRNFHLLVSGAAREWYWLCVKTQGILDWNGLWHALLGQFQSTRSNLEIMRDLVERKQQFNETLDEYFDIMNKIRLKLIQPLSEYDMIKIMKKNIKENLGKIVYPIAVSSVEQLQVECREAERYFPRNVIYEEPIGPEMEQQVCVDEVTAQNKTGN